MIKIFLLLILIEWSNTQNFVAPRSNVFQNLDLCTSYECVQTAADILKKINGSIDPCDDFYNFACGKFANPTSILHSKTSQDVFSQLEENFQEQLRELIEQEPDDHDIRPIKMAKGFYKACMNADTFDEIEPEIISKITSEVGGWPINNRYFWDGYSWNWQDAIAKFRKSGIHADYILGFSVVVDIKNTSRRIIKIDQPDFGIEREYLINGFDDTMVRHYYNYMVDVALMFGTNRKSTMEGLKLSLEFEIQLAQIALSTEERKNQTRFNYTMTVKQLQMQFPYMDWVDYFNSLLVSVTVNENDIVNVAAPKFFEQLGQLLLTASKKTISNYLLWRFHQFSVPYSHKEIRDQELKFKAESSGIELIHNRWEDCLQETRDNFNLAVGALYFRKYFNEDIRSAIIFMASKIQEYYRNLIPKLDWMDEITKEAAIKKLDYLTAYVGYPDEAMSDEIIDNYYEKLQVDDLLYYESYLNVSKFKNDAEDYNLRDFVVKADWMKYSEITSIRPFYSSMDNLIYIPAGFLQEQIFSLNRPNYVNFGRIGLIISQIIVHVFDDEGRNYDLDGNYVDWWSMNTKNLFTAKAECIIDQYNNYRDLKEPKLNDTNTGIRNIGELVAFEVADFAYNNWADQNGRELQLPGLDQFTSNQMYWISAAQTMCSARKPENTKMQITPEDYFESYFRVSSALSNLDKFSIDFKCKVGSKMNPIERCDCYFVPRVIDN